MFIRRQKNILSLLAAVLMLALQFHGVLHAFEKAGDDPCPVCATAQLPSSTALTAASPAFAFASHPFITAALPSSPAPGFSGASLSLRGPPVSLAAL